MKIGILQTGLVAENLVDEFGEYPEMFAEFLSGHGFEFQAYNITKSEFPKAATDCDGWLITGSKHGAYEDHDWIPPLEELIREIYAAKRPIIGVCFGHQIIAQALGGKVEKSDKGWRVGRQIYQLDGHDAPKEIYAWHQDQVVELPDDAQVVGETELCPYAALRYGDIALTIQPHPEFSKSYTQALLDHRGKGIVPDEILAEAEENQIPSFETKDIAAEFAAFFKAAANSP